MENVKLIFEYWYYVMVFFTGLIAIAIYLGGSALLTAKRNSIKIERLRDKEEEGIEGKRRTAGQ